MKPHIYKVQHLWFCSIIAPYRTDVGIGYSFIQAYQDWVDLRAGQV